MTLWKFSRPRFHVTADGLIVDENGQVYDVAKAIRELPWTTAMQSSGAPHQYCVQRRCPEEAWAVLSTVIAKHPDAYLAFHRGYKRPMKYWEFEGLRYWRTAAGAYPKTTHMLNRCRVESDTPRRVDHGATAIKWDGPPWLPYGSPWPPGWVEDSRGEYGYVYHAQLDTRRDYRCKSCGTKFYWESERPCPQCRLPASEL